ncbi:SIMPL domain-containing protein [bacterium]|nr:SIMPL domain-containing protein [bacterium]
MKKNGRFLVVVLVIFLAVLGILKYSSKLTWSLSTTTTSKESAFRVSAVGEVYAKPDTAEINLGVEKEAKTVAKAQEEINEINNKLIDDLKKLGVESKDIKTTQYRINPRYEYERQSGKRNLVGYQAVVNILVKTKDFEKLNQIIDSATAAGANRLNGLSFVIEDKDAVAAEARDKAINKAKDKAKAIAKASGMSLGRIINVSVSDSGYYPAPRAYEMDMMKGMVAEEMAEATQVEAGETKISVGVTLSYEIK